MHQLAVWPENLAAWSPEGTLASGQAHVKVVVEKEIKTSLTQFDNKMGRVDPIQLLQF